MSGKGRRTDTPAEGERYARRRRLWTIVGGSMLAVGLAGHLIAMFGEASGTVHDVGTLILVVLGASFIDRRLVTAALDRIPGIGRRGDEDPPGV